MSTEHSTSKQTHSKVTSHIKCPHPKCCKCATLWAAETTSAKPPHHAHPPAISLASFHLTPLDHAIVFLFHCLHVPLLLPFTAPCPTTDEALAFTVKHTILLHVHGLHVHHAKNSSSREEEQEMNLSLPFSCAL